MRSECIHDLSLSDKHNETNKDHYARNFKNHSNDKSYNLQNVIRQLAAQGAKARGADVIAFHECSITGYTFARHFDKEQLTAIAQS